MNQTTFDPSKELQIFLRKSRIGSKTFVFTSSSVAYPLTGKTFRLFIKAFPHSTSNLIALTIGSGLTIGGAGNNELTAAFTVLQTTLKPQDYYWELYNITDSVTWLNGIATLHDGQFDGVSNDSTDITIELSGADVDISIELPSNGASVASQSDVNAGTVSDEYVSPSTLAAKALLTGTYSTTLTFSTDQDIYKDATGLSPVFTLGAGGINGVGIILRLNKPTAVTFPANFEADANSAALDATKLNVYFLVYFSNWNGTGTARVIYKNALFTAL